MLPPRNPSQIERYTQTRRKGLEKDSSCKWKRQKAGVPVPISDKIDFKTQAILRDKEGHYIMINETIQQKDITLVNIYVNIYNPSKYLHP